MYLQGDTDLPELSGATLRPHWVRHVVVGLAATAALTAVFWVTDLDLRAQALAYSPVEPHWPLGQLPAWALVYHVGTLPGLMLSVLAAVGLGLSFLRPEFSRWRYPCLFLVLLLALGPGLMINLMAKGFGGRPRPDQIVQFGGLLEFRRPFQPGLPHKGFSFMCGHCSMGFMFMGFFFLLRGWKRWACLAGGFLFGTVQGIGRMAQGAHFASDALLSGTAMFTLAAALSPLAASRLRTVATMRHGWRIAAATGFLIVLMVGGFLLSMPVREENVHVWLEAGRARPSRTEKVLKWGARRGGPPPAEIMIEVEVGDIVLELARQPEPVAIRSLITGFAFPGAGSDIDVKELDGGRTVSYRQSLSGLFMEKHGTFRVTLREDLTTKLRLATRDGDIVLAGSFAGRPLAVSGRFRLLDAAAGLQAAGAARYTRPGDGPPVILQLEAQKVLVQP
jgi:membrane-associated PAP2 superfamily phosphatase